MISERVPGACFALPMKTCRHAATPDRCFGVKHCAIQGSVLPRGPASTLLTSGRYSPLGFFSWPLEVRSGSELGPVSRRALPQRCVEWLSCQHLLVRWRKAPRAGASSLQAWAPAGKEPEDFESMEVEAGRLNELGLFP